MQEDDNEEDDLEDDEDDDDEEEEQGEPSIPEEFMFDAVGVPMEDDMMKVSQAHWTGCCVLVEVMHVCLYVCLYVVRRAAEGGQGRQERPDHVPGPRQIPATRHAQGGRCATLPCPALPYPVRGLTPLLIM